MLFHGRFAKSITFLADAKNEVLRPEGAVCGIEKTDHFSNGLCFIQLQHCECLLRIRGSHEKLDLVFTSKSVKWCTWWLSSEQHPRHAKPNWF